MDFCIQGAGRVEVGTKRFDFAQYDVWNVPSMTTYVYENETDDLQVRLSYSNAALLEKMNVHVVEPDPPISVEAPERQQTPQRPTPSARSACLAARTRPT